jgi:hypothetical protein
MKDMKKMMEKEAMPEEMMEAKRDMKMRALKDLRKMMTESSGASLMEAMKPKASLTVATDDPKKLPEALEKAEDMLEKMPEVMEVEEREDDDDDEDLDAMTIDQLKEKIRQIKGQKKTMKA